MTVSVRLKPETVILLSETQRREGKTKSAVIEAALREYCQRTVASGSVYDRIADLVGSVRSGDGSLSEQAGRRMRRGLVAARRAGR